MGLAVDPVTERDFRSECLLLFAVMMALFYSERKPHGLEK